MFRRLFASVLTAYFLFAVPALPAAAEEQAFTVDGWKRLQEKADGRDVRATALMEGYLAGVRDALRFYTKVSKTFPICWPKDHEIDATLIRNIVAAVRREYPEIAKGDDNFAYLVVLSLYNAYPCR